MTDFIEEAFQKGIFVAILFSILFIFASGVFLGVVYFTMETTNNALLAHDCVIVDNSLVSSCQDLWSISFYPFLALRSVLVYASYFVIFGSVLAILLLGYKSGKSPAMLGIMVAFTVGMTYLGIILSNAYRSFLSNEVVYTMMLPFTVYNRIMLFFPWFCFIVCLMGLTLGVVNFQRTPVNRVTPQSELQY
jgi:hypothetical protein